MKVIYTTEIKSQIKAIITNKCVKCVKPTILHFTFYTFYSLIKTFEIFVFLV